MRYLIITAAILLLGACAITSSQKFDRCVKLNHQVCDDFFNVLPPETPESARRNCKTRAIDWCADRYLGENDSFHPSLRDF